MRVIGRWKIKDRHPLRLLFITFPLGCPSRYGSLKPYITFPLGCPSRYGSLKPY